MASHANNSNDTTQKFVSVQIGALWVLVPVEMATAENIPRSTPCPVPQPEYPTHPMHVDADHGGFTPVVTKAMKKRMRKSPSVQVPIPSTQKPNANMRSAPGIVIREDPKDTLNNKEKPPTLHVGKGKGVMAESLDSSSFEMKQYAAQRRFPHIGCSRDMEAFGANSYDKEFPPLRMPNSQQPKNSIKKESYLRTPSRVVPAPVQQIQVNDPSRETSEQHSTSPSAGRLGRPRGRARQNNAPRSWHYQFYSGKPMSYESKYDSTLSSRSHMSESNKDHWERRQSPRYHSAEPTDYETGGRYFFGHHMQRVTPQRNEREDTPIYKYYESTHHQHQYYQQPTHHYEPALTPGGRRVVTRRLTAKEYRLLLQDRAGYDLSSEDRRRVRWLREHLCEVTTVPDLNNPPPRHVMNAMPVSVTDDEDMYFKRRRTIVPKHRPVTRSQSRSQSVSLEVENNDNESSASSYSCSHSNDTIGSVEKEYEPNLLGIEQVLTTDEMSIDDKLIQLQRELQQKEEEIAQLRAQTFANPSTSTNNASDVQHNSTAVSLDTVQRLITEGVRAQLMQNQYAMRPGYTKPYPAEIDMIPFPANYRQPQFAKFNGNGSPHEHIAHFLAACQDTAHNGALLLRQFVQTLSGPAFTWYSKLLPGSIRNWEQMQEAFLQRFYNTQRTVGITELTRTEQAHNERASDFINRWRNLSLHCPQPITEPEAVRMCMNNLRPEMAVHLQGVRPMTFEELASKSTDIENYLNQLNRRSDKGNYKFFEHGLDKGKKDRTRDKNKHVMETSVATQYTKVRPNEVNSQSKNLKFNSVGKPRSLKDRLEKQYSFRKEVVEDFFKGLTEMKLVQLPEPRQVNENNKRHDDGRYCKYHRMPGHTLEECFVFKDKVQEMIDDGTIDPALLKNFKKGGQSANMVSISQVDEKALPKCIDALTLSSYAVPYVPPSYRPMEDSSSPVTTSKVPQHVIHMKELLSPSTPPTIMERKSRTPMPFPTLTC